MGSEKTVDRDHPQLTVNECMAARYLHADGYSTAEIGLALDAQGQTVAKHVRRDCDHPERADPLPAGTIKGKELRRRRAEANLSQVELADRVGVSPATISRWERGRRKPRRDKARLIEEALP